jgi:succinate dehydrogenase hydrophobic anchor subunit
MAAWPLTAGSGQSHAWTREEEGHLQNRSQAVTAVVRVLLTVVIAPVALTLIGYLSSEVSFWLSVPVTLALLAALRAIWHHRPEGGEFRGKP